MDMHHVFEVDEIIRFIASSIELRDCRDAVSFACCCKSFSAPALDAIWGEWQRDLTELLKTLPPSVWVIIDGTFVSSSYKTSLIRRANLYRAQDFVRQPSEEEWERFSVYARRMRYFMGFMSASPSEAALKILNARFSGRCMLPKALDIRWIVAPPEYLELVLPLIVSPVLTNFRLGLSVHGPIKASKIKFVLEALAPARNSLVEICVCDPIDHDPQVVEATSTLLLNCNPDKLRYFRVDSALSTEAFIHTTQLPNLKSFLIRTDTTEPDAPLPTSMFPSLTTLEINATNTRSPFLESITHIQSRNLGWLELVFPASTLKTFLPTTLAALRPRGLHQTLTHLTVTPDGDFDLDRATIRPLLFLQQLTRLEITLSCHQERCPYKLSDENLEELIKAMPKLETLCLGPIPCSHPADNTIKSLVSIAKHCKNLAELSIHINPEAIVAEVLQGGDLNADLTIEDPLSGFVGCPLRGMILGPCFIPSDEQGAMILAFTLLRLFPRLYSVLVIALTHERDPLWEFVNDVIITYRRTCMNIANAGKFTESLSCMKFAHGLQQAKWR